MGHTRWEIDPSHSTIEFATKHMMFTTVRGRFKEFQGTLYLDEDAPDRSRAEAAIQVASLDTGDANRDGHLRSPDFFDADNHPEITFRSKDVAGANVEEGTRFRVTGDLSIAGSTEEIVLDVLYQGRGEDPWGGQRVGFSATSEIDRREWGLRWNQALETGGVLVANKVRLEVEIQAVLQQEEAGEAQEASAEG